MSAIIPTLDINTPVLTNNSDKLIYILKFLVLNPGWTSSWYDAKLLSMRRDMAKYTEDSDKLVPQLTNLLNDVVHQYYPDYYCTITVIKDETISTNYSMDINICDATGTSVIALDRIYKDESGVFKFKDK